MKTKTNSFTKFINFSVLALFFISTLIFFTSCDNGNSPNDNTKEEQNNTQNTDYCEICDGLQTENCGIKHKCDDENCVEYSNNKIYKNGHTHDYCEKTDCDGRTHMGQAHPEYESWFKETTIGGEGSPIKIRYVDLIEQPDSGTPAEKNQDRVDQYKKYIVSFTIYNELTNVKLDNTVDSFDALIGSTDDENSYYNKNGINDICKPAIEKITQNISNSGNVIDKTLFKMYYEAISNEAYRLGFCADITTKKTLDGSEPENSFEKKYIQAKANCSKYDGNDKIPFEYKYFYLENGELNPEVVEEFDSMIQTVATKLGYEDTTELYKCVNLSILGNVINGTHDYDASSINHSISGTCTENEMVNVISGTNLLTKSKLNKSIFSHDYGRELV
ncbi:MAG: hypothetical protein IJ361_06655 [Spirochaetaceae bacterium]|nr:hypothetical protein [Spirochaetaceae bacterium]